MKKYFLSLILLLFILMTAFPAAAYNGNDNLIWIAEPELEYDRIYYCGICNLFGDGVRGDINVGDINYFGADLANVKTYLADFSSGYNGSAYVSAGHGYTTSEYFYDEEKEIFVRYWGGDSGAGIEYYKIYDFTNNFSQNQLIPVRKIDSENFEFDEMNGFNYAYAGDKYALMYGDKFITGFIYDDYESRGSRYTVKDIIDMKSDGKFGIIDRNGNVSIPFLFEDVEFIDDNNAFVKYNGKYGVLDVRKTMLEFSASPATGDSVSIYIFILFFTLVLISFLISMSQVQNHRLYSRSSLSRLTQRQGNENM